MAEDRKLPGSGSILAPKGTAQPWTRDRDEKTERDDQSELRRPKGLHERPDLFGSSSVKRREADEDLSAVRGENGIHVTPQQPPRPAGSSDSLSASGVDDSAARPAQDRDQDRDAETTPRTPFDSLVRASKTPPPASGPHKDPKRSSESAPLEDWPDQDETEQEPEARSPYAAASQADDDEPDFLDLEDGQQEAARDGAGEAKAVKETTDESFRRRASLAASLQVGGHGENARPGRWALAAGAVSCAALLLAVLFTGIIPSSDDPETTRSAATDGPSGPAPAQTASQDTASQNMGGPLTIAPSEREVSIAPAAGEAPQPPFAGEPEQPIEPKMAEPTGPAGNSQVAAVPDPRGPDAGDVDGEPIVDFMRIDPDGRAVVAGRASPGTRLVILDNGVALGTVTADIYGLWTFVSAEPMASGRHEIGLKVQGPGSDLSTPVVTDAGPPEIYPDASRTRSEAPTRPEAPAETAALSPSDLRPVRPELPADAEGSISAAMAPPAEITEPAMPASPSEMIAAANPTTVPDVTADAQPLPTGQTTASQPPAADSADTATSEAGDAGVAATSPAEETTTQLSAIPEAPPKPEPKPAGGVQTAAATPPTGRYVVQLASFRNAASAAREQAILEQRFSDLLIGLELFVEQGQLQNQDTVYRVRTGPFATLAEARTACAEFQERERDCLAMRR